MQCLATRGSDRLDRGADNSVLAIVALWEPRVSLDGMSIFRACLASKKILMI
jgi:hypothetical protein